MKNIIRNKNKLNGQKDSALVEALFGHSFSTPQEATEIPEDLTLYPEVAVESEDESFGFNIPTVGFNFTCDIWVPPWSEPCVLYPTEGGSFMNGDEVAVPPGHIATVISAIITTFGTMQLMNVILTPIAEEYEEGL